ncbi:MAG: hypothetical protein ACFBRM_05340 [Pikeienuella sp.]
MAGMIGRIIQKSIDGTDDFDPDWVPADHVSRDDWQLIAEETVLRVRRMTGRPAFGVSEAEVSVHYHKPVDAFAGLVLERLGISRF